MGGRDVNPPAVPPPLQREYQQAVLGLLTLPLKVDDAGSVAEDLLDFESAALDSFLEFARWVEPQLAPYGDLGTMTDWGGKLVGTVVRLCGVLHMAEHSRNPTPWQRLIGVGTVKNAILIANYLIAHAKSAYAEMGADPAVEGAKYLLGWIKRAGVDSFTKRDAFEGTKGRFKKVTALESVLALLCDHGYIRERPVGSQKGPGRHASPTYDVNPYTQSQNSHNSHNSPANHHSANTANCASPDLVTDHLHEMVLAPAEPPDLEVLSVGGFE